MILTDGYMNGGLGVIKTKCSVKVGRFSRTYRLNQSRPSRSQSVNNINVYKQSSKYTIIALKGLVF